MKADPVLGPIPPDFTRSPNQADQPAVYELENAAMDPDGLLMDAMRQAAAWAGRTLVDLGCGSGYWLPGYTAEAAHVIGVEPDPSLVALAAERSGGAQVLHGSAEHIPLPEDSVDVVHALRLLLPPGM